MCCRSSTRCSTSSRPGIAPISSRSTASRERSRRCSDGELRPMPGTDPPRDGDEAVGIGIEDPAGCLRFVGRLLRDVEIGESPPWLKARLRHAGVRAISNVVDVTNYVMLALGSPLHAYDFDLLHGGLVARRAHKGEKLRTLDGVERTLTDGRSGDRRRRAGGRARRDHGRRGDRGLLLDEERPARGRELRAGRDPAQLRAALAAHRGLEPLGEGRRPVRGRPGCDLRDAADRRA